MSVLGVIGIIVALIVFLVGVYKGLSAFWVAPIAVLIVALTNGIAPLEALFTGSSNYLQGMWDMASQIFACVFLGAMMGRIFTVSGAGKKIATTLIGKFVPINKGRSEKTVVRIAVAVLIIINGIFMFGGIDAYTATFIEIPIILTTFEMCDIPKRFACAALIMNWCFVIIPGCPSIFNVLGSAASTMAGYPLTAGAGLVPGIVAGVFGAVVAWFSLSTMIIRAKKKGEHFAWGNLPHSELDEKEKTPPFIISIIPLVVVFVLYTIVKLDIFWALGAAIIVALILLTRFVDKTDEQGAHMNLFRRAVKPLNEGALSYPGALMNVITPAGLAAVIIGTSAFGTIVSAMSNWNMSPLLLTVICTCIIVGITSSPPVAINVVIPICIGIAAAKFGPDNVPAAAIMRIAVVAATTFETLPFNGAVVLGIQLSGESHKTSYRSVCMVSVVIPLAASLLAALLFAIYPFA